METDLFNQPEFDGAVYVPHYDKKRLTGQLERIFNLMKDGKFRTVNQIHDVLGYPQASISAQLRNLKKERYGGHGLEKQHVGDRANGLWEFKIIVK